MSSRFFEKPIFDSKYYEDLCNKFRSPHLWYWDENLERWSLRHKVSFNNKMSQEESALVWEGNKSKKTY